MRRLSWMPETMVRVVTLMCQTVCAISAGLLLESQMEMHGGPLWMALERIGVVLAMLMGMTKLLKTTM